MSEDALRSIRLLGRTIDDLEIARIENGNRIAAAQREGYDLPWMDVIQSGMSSVEHEAKLAIKRLWRRHPLAPWAKAIPGLGELLIARLIAEIGDPASRENPGKLLAYCGHGDPALSIREKGATQEDLFRRGNPYAKKAVWKIAKQFERTVGSEKSGARSPYRDLYDERKTQTEGRLHSRECRRCGPSGSPAQPGDPWSDAHRQADALRVIGKRFLIDLWVAARELD